MKKFYALFLGIFLSLSLFAQNPAMSEITSIQRILLQASESVLQAENQLQQEIVHFEIDLLTGNDYKWTYRFLYPGWTYTIYAEGEEGMISDADMKIMVQDPDSEEFYEVCKDEKEEFGAFLQLQPPRALRYAIGVRAAKYKEGWSAGHYYFMIMHPKPSNTDNE